MDLNEIQQEIAKLQTKVKEYKSQPAINIENMLNDIKGVVLNHLNGNFQHVGKPHKKQFPREIIDSEKNTVYNVLKNCPYDWLMSSEINNQLPQKIDTKILSARLLALLNEKKIQSRSLIPSDVEFLTYHNRLKVRSGMSNIKIRIWRVI